LPLSNNITITQSFSSISLSINFGTSVACSSIGFSGNQIITYQTIFVSAQGNAGTFSNTGYALYFPNNNTM